MRLKIQNQTALRGEERWERLWTVGEKDAMATKHLSKETTQDGLHFV